MDASVWSRTSPTGDRGAAAVAPPAPPDAAEGGPGLRAARLPPEPRRRAARVLRCYPVSLVLLAPYLLLIIPTAVWNDNPQTGFILRLVGLALLGSVGVETLGLLLGRPTYEWRRGLQQANAQYPRIYQVACLVAVTSILAGLLGAYAGRGTIVAQVTGELPDSQLATLTALFSGWGALAFALLVASHVGGQVSTRRLLGWLAALTLTQVVLAAITAISAPLLGFTFFVAAAGAVCGVFRLRYLLVGVALLLLVWPAMFQYRNGVRQDHGIVVSQEVTAVDRLRLDRQLATVAQFDVPVDLDQPDVRNFIRYGVLPRAIDPDRPPLTTGQDINQYLGGNATSAYTFLVLGNVYFFAGPVGVVVYYASWAAVVVALLRWRGAPGPVRLSLFCFVLADPLLWSSTYPDSAISFVQHSVSALPVFAMLWLTRRRPDPAPGRYADGPPPVTADGRVGPRR
ncbi:hypothetical protein [Micromonospora sp. NPDC092111]|uniref:hypothetical protein n=1 Tax=Micromonospora sp. NPDC092111 TaxID=3364289 RepID=UPI0038282259